MNLFKDIDEVICEWPLWFAVVGLTCCDSFVFRVPYQNPGGNTMSCDLSLKEGVSFSTEENTKLSIYN